MPGSPSRNWLKLFLKLEERSSWLKILKFSKVSEVRISFERSFQVVFRCSSVHCLPILIELRCVLSGAQKKIFSLFLIFPNLESCFDRRLILSLSSTRLRTRFSRCLKTFFGGESRESSPYRFSLVKEVFLSIRGGRSGRTVWLDEVNKFGKLAKNLHKWWKIND